MKYSILGAGAMGSLFGGLLAADGHAVELLDVNEAHIAQVRDFGLVLETDAGTRTVEVPIRRPEHARQAPDWLIVFTKTMHTDSALRSAARLLTPATRLLSLQNGLGNIEKLSAFASPDRIAIGTTTVPADLAGPGHVRSHGHGHCRLMMADGRTSDALTALVGDFNRAGLGAAQDSQVLSAIWQKVAFNAALNSLCAVGGCTVGQLGGLTESRELAHAVAGEVLEVARAIGHAVDDASVHATLDDAMDHHTNHQPSMLQDVLARRATEVEAINGEVVRLGRRHGVNVPRNALLRTLVLLRESTYRPG